MVRYRHHFIWEIELDADRRPSPWSADERLSIMGPEDLEMQLTPQLQQFLGGERAADDVEGVRQGDRLLAVSIQFQYVYYGYIYFDTTRETRRQKRIFNEPGDAPVIGTCYSAPAKIWNGPAEVPTDTELATRLQSLLPPGTNLLDSAAGFKNLGQFIYTVHLSHNLDIPFEPLKARILGGESLWQAVRQFKQDLDGMAEVRKVWDEASIHRRVLNDVFRYLNQLGYSRVINEVMAHNQPSHKANIAVGMNICRELRDWTLLKHLVVQKVDEAGRSYWRLLLV